MTSISYFDLVSEKKAEAAAIGRLNDIKKDLAHLNRMGSGQQPTRVAFKTVVENFAERNGVEFIPKNGKFHEGLQVWSFNNVLCYMDQNVLYAHSGLEDDEPAASAANKRSASGGQSSQWIPMSLEELLAYSRGK